MSISSFLLGSVNHPSIFTLRGNFHSSLSQVAPVKCALGQSIPKTQGVLAKDVIEMEKRVFVQTYARQPVLFVEGKGCVLLDEKGKEYLDMTAGIAVNALGHGDVDWVNSIIEQAGKLAHVSNIYYSIPQVFSFRLT